MSTESVIQFVEKKHSQTGASGYHRWKEDACPGSVRMIRTAAPAELLIEDEVRDDGIEAHGIAEALLKTTDKVERAVLRAKLGNEGTPYKMINDVARYVEYVERLATLPDAQLWVEQFFDLDWLWTSPIYDDRGKETGEYESCLYGTSDAVVYAPESRFLDLEANKMYDGPILHVIDLKYGFKRVEAKENPQGLYYALGAYAKLRAEGKKVNRVVIHIYQPRVHGMSSQFLTWSCDEAYLEKFAIQLQNDVSTALEDDAPLNPNPEWCRLCKARTVCPELVRPGYDAAVLQLMNEGKDPAKELPSLEHVMNDKAAQFRVARLAAVWADGLKTRLRVEMNQGQKYEGLKLIAGRNSRYLVNGHEVQQMFPRETHPELYEEPELKSAAQILEALSTKLPEKEVKKFADKYVRSKPGDPLVALKGDKAEEYNPVQKAVDEWKDELAPVAPAAPVIPPPPAAPVQMSIFAAPAAPVTPSGVMGLPPPPPMAYNTPSIFNK